MKASRGSAISECFLDRYLSKGHKVFCGSGLRSDRFPCGLRRMTAAGSFLQRIIGHTRRTIALLSKRSTRSLFFPERFQEFQMTSDYSPKQIAQALSVSESSVKRWCDRGIIESTKTLGGHRRISSQALQSFLKVTNRKPDALVEIPTEDPSYSGSRASSAHIPAAHELQRPYFQLQQRLLQGLLRNDEQACRMILMQFFSFTESVAELADQLIAPCFKTIGDLWHSGDVCVFEERQAVTTIIRLLHEFRRMIPTPSDNARVAIGASPSDDNYLLPTTLVETVLRQSNIRATNLGTNVPFDSLLEAVQRFNADFVWLSISYLEEESTLQNQLNQFIASLPVGTTMLIGGRAASPLNLAGNSQVMSFSNLRELENFAQRLNRIS